VLVLGPVTIESAAKLNPAGEPGSVFIISGGDVVMERNAEVSALIYARNGHTQITGSSSLYGAVIAHRISIQGNATVTIWPGSKSACF
jgi:hypothetical protein